MHFLSFPEVFRLFFEAAAQYCLDGLIEPAVGPLDSTCNAWHSRQFCYYWRISCYWCSSWSPIAGAGSCSEHVSLACYVTPCPEPLAGLQCLAPSFDQARCSETQFLWFSYAKESALLSSFPSPFNCSHSGLASPETESKILLRFGCSLFELWSQVSRSMLCSGQDVVNLGPDWPGFGYDSWFSSNLFVINDHW